MDTAVIYCRKSDPSATTDDESFENQEDTCRQYAKEKGYSVYKVFREAHSGADLLHRPMIWEAIDDIRSGNAQVLLVRNFDRLARKSEHAAVIKYEIREKAKGRVEAALDKNGEETLSDKITDLIAEGERQSTVARMERGKLRRLARGELPAMSNPLFGYAWLDDEPGKRTAFVIDPDTGKIVQRIFHLVNTGRSFRSICKLFNAEGVPTPAQWTALRNHIGRHQVGQVWRQEQIRRIVVNHAYTGNETNTPALIDEQTFESAQRAIQERDSGRPPTDREATWLRHHVYCGVCHSRMVVTFSKKEGKYRYQCRRRPGFVGSDNACPGGDFGIRAFLLDLPVYESLCHILMNREQVTQLMLKRIGTDRIANLMSIAEGFQAQIRENQDLLRNARKLSLQTSDEDLAKQYMQEAEELNAQIHKLEQEYAQARDELDNLEIGPRWVKSTLARIYDDNPIREAPTPEDIKEFPYEEKRLLLAVTGLRAEVYPKNWTGPRDIGCTTSEKEPRRVEVFFSWELTHPRSER